MWSKFEDQWYEFLGRWECFCDDFEQWKRAQECRWKGHAGPIWYTLNLDATEPDMHCKNCGEDLG
jgi:hypothetical protein